VRIAKQLLEKGEQELFEKQHYQPKKCEYYDTAYDPFHLHFSEMILWLALKPSFKKLL
jgi:hypothetical protein